MESLLTLNDAAIKLTVSKDTIKREIKAGRLKAFKIGKLWRFTQEDFDKYLKSRKTA